MKQQHFQEENEICNVYCHIHGNILSSYEYLNGEGRAVLNQEHEENSNKNF